MRAAGSQNPHVQQNRWPAAASTGMKLKCNKSINSTIIHGMDLPNCRSKLCIVRCNVRKWPRSERERAERKKSRRSASELILPAICTRNSSRGGVTAVTSSSACIASVPSSVLPLDLPSRAASSLAVERPPAPSQQPAPAAMSTPTPTPMPVSGTHTRTSM
jgi:hypothetical protein